MESSFYQIAQRIIAGNASDDDQLVLYGMAKSFISSKKFRIQILNHLRINYPNKDEIAFKKDELDDLEGDAYEIARRVLPDATRVAGHYPDTRRDNILCGYIKKSVEREIWNKLNKNDPGHVLFQEMTSCLSELVANESSGIRTIVHEKLKYYFSHTYSELAEKFSNLNWKEKIKCIRFPAPKGTKAVKNPTPGQIKEIVPMVLDELKQPLNQSQLTKVLVYGFELKRPMVVGLSDGDDEDSKHEKDLNKVAKDEEIESFDYHSPGKAQELVELSLFLVSLVEKEDGNQKIGKRPMEGGPIGNVLADYFIWALSPTKDGKKYSFEKYYKLFKIDKEVAADRRRKLEVIIKDMFSDYKYIQDSDLSPKEKKYDHSSCGSEKLLDMRIELRKRFSLRKPKFIEDPSS
jgi:hypothetical protein